MEREPKRGFKAHGRQYKHVDTAIWFARNIISRPTGVYVPRLMPRNSTLLKQGDDAFGDTVVSIDIHGHDPPWLIVGGQWRFRMNRF